MKVNISYHFILVMPRPFENEKVIYVVDATLYYRVDQDRTC